MSNREALAKALDVVSDGPLLREMTRHNAAAFAEATAALVEAARERLAQLPQKCTTRHYYDGPHRDDCPSCHGSGKVYPAELVERIREAIREVSPKYQMLITELVCERIAVAVLDALNHPREGT